MTENFSTTEPDLQQMFAEGKPFPLEVVNLWAEGATPLEVLKLYNKDRGLALDQLEVSKEILTWPQMFSELILFRWSTWSMLTPSLGDHRMSLIRLFVPLFGYIRAF